MIRYLSSGLLILPHALTGNHSHSHTAFNIVSLPLMPGYAVSLNVCGTLVNSTLYADVQVFGLKVQVTAETANDSSQLAYCVIFLCQLT